MDEGDGYLDDRLATIRYILAARLSKHPAFKYFRTIVAASYAPFAPAKDIDGSMLDEWTLVEVA